MSSSHLLEPTAQTEPRQASSEQVVALRQDTGVSQSVPPELHILVANSPSQVVVPGLHTSQASLRQTPVGHSRGVHEVPPPSQVCSVVFDAHSTVPGEQVGPVSAVLPSPLSVVLLSPAPLSLPESPPPVPTPRVPTPPVPTPPVPTPPLLAPPLQAPPPLTPPLEAPALLEPSEASFVELASPPPVFVVVSSSHATRLKLTAAQGKSRWRILLVTFMMRALS